MPVKLLAIAVVLLWGSGMAAAQTAATTGSVVWLRDLGPAGTLLDSDQFPVCQNAAGCGPTTPLKRATYLQLKTFVRSLFSASAPLAYNAGSGAFSISLPNAQLIGSTPGAFQPVSIGSGLQLVSGVLSATATPPPVSNCVLLQGGGCLQLQAGAGDILLQ